MRPEPAGACLHDDEVLLVEGPRAAAGAAAGLAHVHLHPVRPAQHRRRRSALGVPGETCLAQRTPAPLPKVPQGRPALS